MLADGIAQEDGSRPLGTKAVPGFLSRRQGLCALALIVCIAIYALGANPFNGQTVAPFNMLMADPGWALTPSDININSDPSDIMDSLLPAWITLKGQIRSGEGILWIPVGAGGQPIAQELFDPAFLVFVLVKDNALGFYLALLLKLVVAGFGAYLLMRVYLRWLPSIWGGAVYMLGGFSTAWLYWNQVTTSMWIPWLLWATLLYLKSADRRMLPVISIASLMLLLGGYPPVAAFGFYAFALLVFVWNARGLITAAERRASAMNTALPFLAVAIAFVMAGVALLPFASDMSGINLSYRAGGGTWLNGLVDLPLFVRYEIPLRVERTAYVGVLVILLAAAGAFSALKSSDSGRRKFIVFGVLLTLLSTAIAFGLLPHGLISSLPVFSSVKWNRVLVLTLMGLSILSSAGLGFAADRLHILMGGGAARHAGGVVAVALTLVLAFQVHSLKAFFNDYNAVVPDAWFYPMTPSIAYVKERIQPLQTVLADNSYMISGTVGAYGLSDWFAHTFRTDREKEVLSALVKNPFSSATSAYIYTANIDINSPLMDRLAIRFLMLNTNELSTLPWASEIPPKWKVTQAERNVLVLENTDVTGGAYFIGDLGDLNGGLDFADVAVVRAAPMHVTVDYRGAKDGWVVLPMHMNPGWKAYIGGRRVDYNAYMGMLPAIPVRGPSKVEFDYEPGTFWLGVCVSLTGVALWLIMAWRCLGPPRCPGPPPASAVRPCR